MYVGEFQIQIMKLIQGVFIHALIGNVMWEYYAEGVTVS